MLLPGIEGKENEKKKERESSELFYGDLYPKEFRGSGRSLRSFL